MMVQADSLHMRITRSDVQVLQVKIAPGPEGVFMLMQAIIQILQPLAGPKVGEAVRKTVNELFGAFAQSMSAAFQKFMRPDGTFPPRLGEHRGCPSAFKYPC